MARKRQRALPGSPHTHPHFIKPLIKAMGRLTHFRAGVFVDSKEVIYNALKEAGYDPDHLEKHGSPELGWRMLGQKNKNGCCEDGFLRRFYYAHRAVRDKQYFPKTGSFKGMPLLTTLGKKRGQWGLTKAGAQVAKKLCGFENQNVTSIFLNERLSQGDLYTQMQNAVISKLPLSAAIGTVEDHVQNCLVKLIRRDSLRDRILLGNPPTNSHLATYAVRTGFTDIRKDGTEPVCREMYGAQTETERAKIRALESQKAEQDMDNEAKPTRTRDAHIVLGREDDGSISISDIAEFLPDNAAVEAKMAFNDLWVNIESVVKVKKPQAWKRYMAILQRVASGWSIKEIATQENITQARACALIADARRCVREGRSENLMSAAL